MFNYLARLGKRNWTKNVVPTFAFLAGGTYFGAHTFLHNQLRNLLAAQNDLGLREELSDHLKDTIIEAYDRIKDRFGIPLIKTPLDKPPEIKWFCSSTLDPVNFGFSESSQGILIGLPANFNYEKPEDVPQEALHYKKMRFFKDFGVASDETNEALEDQGLEDISQQSKGVTDVVLRKFSELGEEYISTLVLSKNAKQFVVTRELFYSDSYKVILDTFNLILSVNIALMLSRALVKKLGLGSVHVIRRCILYSGSGCLGLTYFQLMKNLVERLYSLKSDSKAMAVDESYRMGAVEYYEKVLARNRILKKTVHDLRYAFDETGNPSTSIFAQYILSPSESLEHALKFKRHNQEKESQEASEEDKAEKVSEK